MTDKPPTPSTREDPPPLVPPTLTPEEEYIERSNDNGPLINRPRLNATTAYNDNGAPVYVFNDNGGPPKFAEPPKAKKA